MSKHKKSLRIEAPVNTVFDFISNVENLPKYLPTVSRAHSQGAQRVQVEGESHGHRYNSDGYFRVDPEKTRIEWGSDGEHEYSGWMKASGHQHACEVTIELSFGDRQALAARLEEQAHQQGKRGRDDVIAESIEAALWSIKNHCEGHGGKVQTEATS